MKKLYYYGGLTCSICKVLRPKVSELCAKVGVGFIPQDADENEQSVLELGLRSLPAMAVYGEDGELEMKGSGWAFYKVLEEQWK